MELKSVKASLSGFNGSLRGRAAASHKDLIAAWKMRQRVLGRYDMLDCFNQHWQEMYSFAFVLIDMRKVKSREYEKARRDQITAKKKYNRIMYGEKDRTQKPSKLQSWDELRSSLNF